MKKLCYLIVVISIIFFVHGNSIAQKQEIKRYADALHTNRGFNGVILVAAHGNIIFQKGYGYADFAKQKRNTAVTQFPIASITKTFTATAILQLQDKGLLAVDDPVQQYLPAFPYANITLRHLLSHTSGLPSWENVFDCVRKAKPDTTFTNADILPCYAAMRLPLLYVPGTSFGYNNANFVFLALVVEQVSHMPYRDYIRSHIFKPASMHYTFIPQRSIYVYDESERAGMARPYQAHLYSDMPVAADTMKDVIRYWNTFQFKGSGDFVSITSDLFKYFNALQDGKLVKPATLAEAFIPGHLNDGSPNPSGIGIGWQIEQDSTWGKLVGHGGGLVGLSAALLHVDSLDQTIIILCNTGQNIEQTEADLVRLLNKQQVPIPKKNAARVYGKLLLTQGEVPAYVRLKNMQNDTTYDIIESEFNSLGYDFLRSNMQCLALITFKTNIDLFPHSWNTYDSYGDALLQCGDKSKAKDMYLKSLELNPNNIAAKNIIETLSK